MVKVRSGRPRRSAKKQMLIIVNPYATTVSNRLKNLVVYALQGRFEVETVSTEAQNHATEIGREVRDHGYDVVVAFGGDGTLNEVANGLAGTDVPVSVLPGGSTNVVCRTLGIPNDVVDATEHLLALADDWAPRPIDIDILLYGDEVIDAEDLTVPHPGLTERNFVLAPLAELASDVEHPREHRTIGELAEDIDYEGLEHLAAPDEWWPH